VKMGGSVSMAILINKVLGPDSLRPRAHYMRMLFEVDRTCGEASGPRIQDSTTYAKWIIGRGVLLDIPRFHGLK
jgi:hypothetical protein